MVVWLYGKEWNPSWDNINLFKNLNTSFYLVRKEEITIIGVIHLEVLSIIFVLITGVQPGCLVKLVRLL